MYLKLNGLIEKRRNAMTCMQRLKRVFNINIGQCERYGGHVKVVACIVEDPPAIEKILQHLPLIESPSLSRVNDATGPPNQADLFLREINFQLEH